MIYFVEGIISERLETSVIIETNGVGYQIFVSEQCLHQLPDEAEKIKLFTYHYVREDSQLLFGFPTSTDKQFFELLTSVSGVGAKMAMKMLSGLTTGQIALAIVQEDVKILTKLPGVGKKLAERLILDLKEKVAEFAGNMPEDSPNTAPQPKIVDDLRLALTSLGYKSKEISSAIKKCEADLNNATKVEDGIKIILRHI